jgi:DNA-binding SARP family transcriptional activator
MRLWQAAQVKYDVQGTSDGVREACRVRLLGGFQVSVGDRSIAESEWRLKKAAALVKLLALAPQHRLHREQVVDVLWPGLGPKAATNNLRYALHNARRILGHTPSIASWCLPLRNGLLALYPSGELWVDVEGFEEAAKTARQVRNLPA